MAKQVGPLFITGTIDGIIFYKLGDQYYMRSKGSYKSGKQMRKDPYLKRTMQNADRFGVASKMVKSVYYRQLTREVRRNGLFGKLTGMVSGWLRQGKSIEEAEELLIAYCRTLVPVEKIDVAKSLLGSVQQRTVLVNEEESASMADEKVDRGWPVRKTKRARYLSRWKVKRCGRLQIPRNDASSLMQARFRKSEHTSCKT